MNAATLIHERLIDRKNELALWMPEQGSVSFGELDRMAKAAEHAMRARGVKAGDSLLLALDLSPLMYAVIIAIARMGCTMILVEPWMPLDRIENAVRTVKPRAFIAMTLGFLWGLRVKAIRDIPLRIREKDLRQGAPLETQLESVDPLTPLIITFTTGTTGVPKGVVRTHSYLTEQARVMIDKLDMANHRGPDICIFANFALANLAFGRPSLVIPGKWKKTDIAKLDALSHELQPESLVAGPAFLKILLDTTRLPRLKNVSIGGALIDNSIFERSFAQWPSCRFQHLYGSTEVEPVATGDAREAVRRSRNEGYFQTVFLGKKHPEIRIERRGPEFWVSGPHVCPEYLGDPKANAENKRRDESGLLWHRMGDAIHETEESSAKDPWFVYQGREGEKSEDFRLEQRLYSALGSSEAMISREDNKLIVYAENPKVGCIRSVVPDVDMIYRSKIQRDRRHRARLDRVATRKAKKWPVG